MTDKPTNPNATASPFLRLTVRNSIFSGLGTISAFIIGFIFAGLTIRYLGNSRAGFLLTLQSIIALNGLMGGFGLTTPSVRRVARLAAEKNLKNARSVIGSVSTVNIITGLVLSLLVLVFFRGIFTISRLDPIYYKDAFWATFLICVSFLVGQISNTWMAVYEATQRYDLITGLSTIFGLLSGTLGIIVLKIFPTMAAIAIVGLIVSGLRLICDVFLVQRILQRVPLPTWSWTEVRPLLHFGGWTYLNGLGTFLFTNIDRLVLTAFLGSAALPYYAVPQRLYQQVHSAIANQAQFLFPQFSQLGDKAADEIKRVEDRLRWFVALLSGAAYTGLVFVGPWVLGKLVSPDFAKSATLPMILACIQGFVHAQMIIPYFNSWAVGSGAPNAVAQLANGILVELTAILLIPRLGFTGASLAQLWIIVIVLGHTLWVRHIISPQAHLWTWLRAYISPVLMILTWLCIVALTVQFTSVNTIIYYAAVLLGGIIGIGVVWAIERLLFPVERRWATLVAAAGIPVSHFKAIGKIEWKN